MKFGLLRSGEFRLGVNVFRPNVSGKVAITDEETHPIWGKRYKIEGSTEWFEENCFEHVEDVI